MTDTNKIPYTAEEAKELAEELLEVREAAQALYLAGEWALIRFREGEEGHLVIEPEEQAAMWARLRDALGLPEGAASEVGAGSLTA